MSAAPRSTVPRLHQLMSCDDAAWHDCAVHLAPGDHLLLADLGAAVLANPIRLQAMRIASGGRFGACRADARALGLEARAEVEGVALVDDAGWLHLVAAHSQVLSWT